MYRVILATDDYEESYDSMQDWPYKTYSVFGGYEGEDTDDPARAITLWFRIGKKNPADTYISCLTREDAVRLCEAATPELLTQLWNRYKCPYKLEYLIQACQKQVENGCRYFYENRYGDQVSPFCVG